VHNYKFWYAFCTLRPFRHDLNTPHLYLCPLVFDISTFTCRFVCLTLPVRSFLVCSLPVVWCSICCEQLNSGAVLLFRWHLLFPPEHLVVRRQVLFGAWTFSDFCEHLICTFFEFQTLTIYTTLSNHFHTFLINVLPYSTNFVLRSVCSSCHSIRWVFIYTLRCSLYSFPTTILVNVCWCRRICSLAGLLCTFDALFVCPSLRFTLVPSWVFLMLFTQHLVAHPFPTFAYSRGTDDILPVCSPSTSQNLCCEPLRRSVTFGCRCPVPLRRLTLRWLISIVLLVPHKLFTFRFVILYVVVSRVWSHTLFLRSWCFLPFALLCEHCQFHGFAVLLVVQICLVGNLGVVFLHFITLPVLIFNSHNLHLLGERCYS